MSKKDEQYEEHFGQIGKVFFTTAVHLDPKPMTIAELATPGSRKTLNNSGNHRYFERIDWHPAGVRVWTVGKPPIIVPFERVSTIVMAVVPEKIEPEKPAAKK